MKLLFAVSMVVAALVAAFSSSAGPRREYPPEYFATDNNMVDSVPYDAFAPNPVTRDGKTMIAPPKGSIARGAKPFRYGTSVTEAERAGRELTNPVPPSPEALSRGEHEFQVYCSPCHGPRGLADGLIIPLFSKPPLLAAEHARSLPDGQIFHIISRGQKLMPSLAVQVQPEDRWKIIHFIRSLQNAGTGGAQ